MPQATRTPAPARRRGALGCSLTVALALLASGCGTGGQREDSHTVTLVTHDSFAVRKKTLAAFEHRTGLTVKVLRSGDAGEAVNQAILTQGNPRGDVFFGVDNTLLSRALRKGVFAPYRAAGLGAVPKRLRAGTAHRVTPVDSGDVCVNYDRAYFTKHHLPVPTSFDDLTKRRYRNLLVTENAATSSPGLAFLLATVAHYGKDGWRDYWKKLRSNGAQVVDGWEEAYNTRFSGSAASHGKGTRPLAVSYSSSPPVEVRHPAKTPAKKAPTGVLDSTCFQQTEYAGLLNGASNTSGGKKLLDFLLTRRFQRELPHQMYVWPARDDVRPPRSWAKYTTRPARPASLSPERIAAHRERWVKSWTSLVLK